MNRMGRDTVSVVMDKLPILNKIVRWFKGDDMNIDNHLFKLHYQVRPPRHTTTKLVTLQDPITNCSFFRRQR